MKPSVIIALVIAGGIVIATPVIAEYFLISNWQDNAARVREAQPAILVLRREQLGTWLASGCWFSGTVMAVAGVVLAFRLPRSIPIDTH